MGIVDFYINTSKMKFLIAIVLLSMVCLSAAFNSCDTATNRGSKTVCMVQKTAKTTADDKGWDLRWLADTNDCNGLPDHLGSGTYTQCCNVHDACYNACGWSQSACDTLLDNCMLTYGHHQIARVARFILRNFGGKYYKAAQAEHCECATAADSMTWKQVGNGWQTTAEYCFKESFNGASTFEYASGAFKALPSAEHGSHRLKRFLRTNDASITV